MSEKQHTAFQRNEALDAIAAMLTIERWDQVVELLTDEQVEKLHELVKRGVGGNTLRAFTSDLTYLHSWSMAATGSPLPWPASEALLLKFVEHHLWDPERKTTEPDHGMPDAVEESLRNQGLLRSAGPQSPGTVRRRLSNWATLTKWRGFEPAFPSPSLKLAIRLAARGASRERQPKSSRAVTADILHKLLASCQGDSLRGLRDQAILMVAFASGGRRRSEIATLRCEQIVKEEPFIASDGAQLPKVAIHLDRRDTSGGNGAETVYLVGRPVEILAEWLRHANIKSGSVFRGITPKGNLLQRGLDPRTINDIVKRRVAAAGLDASEFTAHGIRSGYLRDAGDRGIPLAEAMDQSRHRSVKQASRYYNNTAR